MNAQHKHYWKKVLGNMLMFNSFSKRAAAIQYLTEDEKLNSGHKWNCTSCVIPNGIDFSSLKQGIVHNYDNIDNVIKGIFIGRISIYHKGLDLLVDACKQIETLLRKRHVQIEIYGPDREHEKDKLRNLIERKKFLIFYWFKIVQYLVKRKKVNYWLLIFSSYIAFRRSSDGLD